MDVKNLQDNPVYGGLCRQKILHNLNKHGKNKLGINLILPNIWLGHIVRIWPYGRYLDTQSIKSSSGRSSYQRQAAPIGVGRRR